MDREVYKWTWDWRVPVFWVGITVVFLIGYKFLGQLVFGG